MSLGVILKSLVQSDSQDLKIELLHGYTNFDSSVLSFQPLAIDSWHNFLKKIQSLEQKHHLSFFMKDNPKLYALDALTVCYAIPDKISIVQRDTIAEIFLAWYMLLHLFDDYIEDSNKYRTRFSSQGNRRPKEIEMNTSAFSLQPLVLLSISHALDRAAVDYPNRVKLHEELSNGVLEMARVFLDERAPNLTPEEILIVKERGMNGKATGFLSCILSACGVNTNRSIERMLYYLGSLTQITDDIRDMQADQKLNNLNLVNTLTSKYPKDWLLILTNIYREEERLCKEAMDEAGITPENQKLILSLPFYPFCIKNLQTKRPPKDSL